MTNKNSGSQEVIVPSEPEAQDLLGPAVLEDEHQQAVGGCHGEQVQRDGGERHDHRPEGDHQQAERKYEHERDRVRQAVADLAGEVDVRGDEAGDLGLGAADMPRGFGHQRVAQRLDRLPAGLVGAVAGQREGQRGGGIVAAPRELEGRVGDPAAGRPPLQLGELTGERAARRGRGLHDDVRGQAGAGEGVLDRGERPQGRIVRRGQRDGTGLGHVQ